MTGNIIVISELHSVLLHIEQHITHMCNVRAYLENSKWLYLQISVKPLLTNTDSVVSEMRGMVVLKKNVSPRMINPASSEEDEEASSNITLYLSSKTNYSARKTTTFPRFNYKHFTFYLHSSSIVTTTLSTFILVFKLNEIYLLYHIWQDFIQLTWTSARPCVCCQHATQFEVVNLAEMTMSLP